jgi:SAM-dependent methyltransferase
MYLALPAGESPMLIHRVSRPGASILDLGSGPGRLARVLFALGHEVVAVDDSPEMLAHVTGAEPVCGDAFNVELGRRFDTVLAASHLVNEPGVASRRALLRTARRHVAEPGGIVLVERYPPGWLFAGVPIEHASGPVEIRFEPGRREGDCLSASMTYRLAERCWVQRFVAEDVDDDKLAADAERAGLRLVEALTPDRSWVRLEPC